ncbi:hypothetical protein PSL79_18170 [Clostridioides difficile]|nr:hypothetical protein [Clostridioides difficile]
MGRHLWNPSYFVATVLENTGEQRRKYMNNHKKQVKLGGSRGKSL